ncbi:MAG: hypothetical protein RL524_1107 [Actinomycetota bacterium]
MNLPLCGDILLEMTVIASLVVGSNGAASLHGSSRALSTPADRERFLARHQGASAFIIGKKSAAIESYAKSQVPIFSDLGEITRRIDERIPGNIVVEAGPSLLLALIGAGVIEILELSISPIEGDGDFLSIEDLLAPFSIESEVTIDGTRLLQCRYNGHATNS